MKTIFFLFTLFLGFASAFVFYVGAEHAAMVDPFVGLELLAVAYASLAMSLLSLFALITER